MLLGVRKLVELDVFDHRVKSSQRDPILSLTGDCAGPASGAFTKVYDHGPAGPTLSRFGFGGRENGCGNHRSDSSGARFEGIATGCSFWITHFQTPFVKLVDPPGFHISSS
jgi:hypothetical protein